MVHNSSSFDEPGDQLNNHDKRYVSMDPPINASFPHFGDVDFL
jgi:hypothetical protein